MAHVRSIAEHEHFADYEELSEYAELQPRYKRQIDWHFALGLCLMLGSGIAMMYGACWVASKVWK